MSSVAVVVVVCALGTIALKAAGPVLLGGRELPARLNAVVRLAGPSLLAALVATSTFADGQSLVIDARVAGLAAAAVAIRFHTPALLVIVIAAAVTALVRIVA